MRSNANRVFWGVFLLLTGLYYSAREFDLDPDLTESQWAIILAVASIAFFILYFTSKFRDWGMLFPAFITGGLSAIIFLAESGNDGPVMGSIVLWSVAAPFWVALITHPKDNWWASIPGWALTVIGGIILIEDQVGGDLVGSLIMFSIALPFLVTYFRNREQAWPLIPGYALSVITLIILFEEVLGGDATGAFVLMAIALPFYVVYLRNKKNQWALIPAASLTLISLIIFINSITQDEQFIGMSVLIAFGMFFVFVYLKWREQWWAIIPAGILISASFPVILAQQDMQGDLKERVIASTFMGGLAITFGVLWLLRERHGTGWAVYPAAILAAYTVLGATLGFDAAWPITLIILGIWMLIRNVRQKQIT